MKGTEAVVTWATAGVIWQQPRKEQAQKEWSGACTYSTPIALSQKQLSRMQMAAAIGVRSWIQLLQPFRPLQRENSSQSKYFWGLNFSTFGVDPGVPLAHLTDMLLGQAPLKQPGATPNVWP